MFGLAFLELFAVLFDDLDSSDEEEEERRKKEDLQRGDQHEEK